MTVPTDSEMLNTIREARYKLVQNIANGKSIKEIRVGGITVETTDVDKALERLDKLEEVYMGRSITDRCARCAAAEGM